MYEKGRIPREGVLGIWDRGLNLAERIPMDVILLALRIQRSGRLVGQDQLGLPDQGAGGSHAKLVSTPDREGKSVTHQPVGGFHGDIGRRIIRRQVHRIRAVKRTRCGKADVAGKDAGDAAKGHGQGPKA